MSEPKTSTSMFSISCEALQQLLSALQSEGYDVVGPAIAGGAITYQSIRQLEDLPQGWTDDQEAGHYRLKKTDSRAYFGFNLGPHSWKKYLFPARQKLWHSKTNDLGELVFYPPSNEPKRYALLGVRACEIAVNLTPTV